MTDGGDDQIPQAPRQESADFARSVALGFIGAFPAGSVLAALVDAILPAPLEKRRIAFYDAVGRGLEKLKSRVGQYEQILESEDFHSLMTQVAEAVRRDPRKEKLDALAAAISNSGDASNEFYFQQRMLAVLDQLTVVHLIILTMIVQSQNSRFQANALIVEVAHKHFGGDQSKSESFLDDLESRHSLIDWRAPKTSITRDFITTTEIGRQFCIYFELTEV